MKMRRLAAVGLAASLTAGALAGCGGSGGGGGQSTTAAAPTTFLSVRKKACLTFRAD